MKKILFFASALFACSSSAFAAQSTFDDVTLLHNFTECERLFSILNLEYTAHDFETFLQKMASVANHHTALQQIRARKKTLRSGIAYQKTLRSNTEHEECSDQQLKQALVTFINSDFAQLLEALRRFKNDPEVKRSLTQLRKCKQEILENVRTTNANVLCEKLLLSRKQLAQLLDALNNAQRMLNRLCIELLGQQIQEPEEEKILDQPDLKVQMTATQAENNRLESPTEHHGSLVGSQEVELADNELFPQPFPEQAQGPETKYPINAIFAKLTQLPDSGYDLARRDATFGSIAAGVGENPTTPTTTQPEKIGRAHV